MDTTGGAGGREPPSGETAIGSKSVPADALGEGDQASETVPEDGRDARVVAERPSKNPSSQLRHVGRDTVSPDGTKDYNLPMKITVIIGKVTGLLAAATGVLLATARLIEEIGKLL